MAGNPTVQDVLRRFYPKYMENYTPNARQAKTANHILNCKTGAYGVNVSRCGQCGHVQIHNNSCRDRFCPMCQALSSELWVDAQTGHVLDIDYYHIVFTYPNELNPLIYCNQKELYSLFFQAADLMEFETGTRKRGASSCLEKQWPHFLRASFCPA